MEVFYEDLARQNTVAHLSQVQLTIGFSHHRSVLRPLFRTLHGLIIGLFRPICLSSTCLSVTFLSIGLASQFDCLRFFFVASTALSSIRTFR